jgi:transcription initiation factor IIE alpha subunit
MDTHLATLCLNLLNEENIIRVPKQMLREKKVVVTAWYHTCTKITYICQLHVEPYISFIEFLNN